MKHDPADPKHLLGGYAAGNLTAEERQRLLAAALEDQELFNALAEEESLREVLNDDRSRRQLLRAIEESPRRRWAWLWRPQTMALAGTLAAALVIAIVWKQPEHRNAAARIAQPAEPPAGARRPAADLDRVAKIQQSQPVAAPKPGPVAVGRLAETPSVLRNEPAVSTKELSKKAEALAPEAPPPAARASEAALPAQTTIEESRKMRVAVMSFDAPSAAQPQMQQVNQAVGEMLNKRLDQSGAYQLVDQNEVDRVLQSRQQTGPVDAPTAARIGRSLGADAVIIANVTPVTGEAKAKDAKAKEDQGAAAFGARRANAPAGAVVSLSAAAIDTRTSARMAVARGRASVSDSVEQVANQLESQLQRKTGRLQGMVTDVNASILSINIGSQAGLRVGDVLEVVRDGRVMGSAVVTHVTPMIGVARYRGTDTPRASDRVELLPERPKM
jgi:hypothetical protein